MRASSLTSTYSVGSGTQQADMPLSWVRESETQPQHTFALRKAEAKSRSYQE